MEIENQMLMAKGVQQYAKIVQGDISGLSAETREGLHGALNAMSMLPGGGVYDWMNAELYEAEGDKVNAAISRGAILVPGTVSMAAKAVDKGVDIYKTSKSIAIMDAASKVKLDNVVDDVVMLERIVLKLIY